MAGAASPFPGIKKGQAKRKLLPRNQPASKPHIKVDINSKILPFRKKMYKFQTKTNSQNKSRPISFDLPSESDNVRASNIDTARNKNNNKRSNSDGRIQQIINQLASRMIELPAPDPSAGVLLPTRITKPPVISISPDRINQNNGQISNGRHRKSMTSPTTNPPSSSN